jgi:hypothetical protein
MSPESKTPECQEGESAAKRFTKLVKTVVRVPKAEINRRAQDWRESRESKKSETAGE